MTRTSDKRELSAPLVLREVFEGFLPDEHGSFRRFRPGVEILPLYGSAQGPFRDGPAAALLRYEPGASIPEHQHSGYEHILVLRGSQHDQSGHYPRGTCVINPPGTRHAVTSDEGCLVLAIWNQPVVILEGDTP